ncbi:MAG TPA: GNAT family N-acetyltransferase [Longimicrobiales bacterium]
MDAEFDVAPKDVLQTARLRLRRLHEGDDQFILGLLNQPSFLQFIGDKGVRNLEDARSYIRSGPLTSYAEHGFGLYLVVLRESGEDIGVCGILKKPALEHFDLGFAFVPAHWSKGYAEEAATAMLEHARDCGLARICAVVDPDNAASIKLLHKLGMTRTGHVQLAPADKELELFELSLQR